MATPSRIVAALGLLLLGVVGLFAPLRRPADIPVGSPGVLGSRTFLLAGEYTFTTDLGGQRIGKPGAEIDPGRLFAEALVVVSATGLGLVVLPQPGPRQSSPAVQGDGRPRDSR